MDTRRSRPVIAWILIILLLFLGTCGLISGFLLFIKPNGSLIGMPVTYLQGTPFSNYLIPGIILFIFVGAFQVITGYGLITRTNWKVPETINPAKKYHWSWAATWTAELIILIWIMVETALLGYISALQPIIFVWALVLIILTLSPQMREFYKKIMPGKISLHVLNYLETR